MPAHTTFSVADLIVSVGRFPLGGSFYAVGRAGDFAAIIILKIVGASADRCATLSAIVTAAQIVVSIDILR